MCCQRVNQFFRVTFYKAAMKKNFKFLILSLLLLLLVCTSLLEFGIRILKLSPNTDTQYAAYVADDKIGYRHQPNSRTQGRSAGNEFDFDYQHNSLGFRDVERSLTKPSDTFRILALGDSFTYGAGAKFDETYPAILEKLLNQRNGKHPKIEIIRAGISRAFPEMERKVLETYGMKFSPDMIMVGFLPNDIVDTVMAEEAVHITSNGYLMVGSAQMSAFKEWLYLHSHLWRLARYQWYQLKSKIAWKQKYKNSAFIQKAWEKIASEFKNINSIAQNSKIPFLLVYIPQKDTLTDLQNAPEEILKNLGKENNFSTVSTIEDMRSHFNKNEILYYPIDGHCTPLGYKTVAESIFSQIEKLKIVP